MNEELLKAIWQDNGYDKVGPFEKFRDDMMGSPEVRKSVFTDNGYDKIGDYNKFEKDLGLNAPAQQQALPKMTDFKQGPVGVSSPSVMANPGMDDAKLSKFYTDPQPMITSGGVGSGYDPSTFKNKALANSETQAAALVNQPGDVLSVAKSVYGQNLGKKESDYSDNPQIADAVFSFESLAMYKENARLISDRSRQRLALLHSDKYSKPEIENAINTYTALSLMGDIGKANEYIAKFPELAGDPNLNNIVNVNQKLRQVSLAQSHVVKNNPEWVARQQKVKEKQAESDKEVKDYREEMGALRFLPGPGTFLSPNALNAMQSWAGKWSKNLAGYVGPEGAMNDWGRDMMDFNSRSSDYKGHIIEDFKPIESGGKKYDVVYDKGKVSYVRDTDGFIVTPTEKEMKAIEDAATKAEMHTRVNPKPIVAQTADVMMDMAPIVGLTALTGGIGEALGMSANAAKNIGMIVGSNLQMRGDIKEQMLLHPDISPFEAEMYTNLIGTGIGGISLFVNPLEKMMLTGKVQGLLPSILRSNSAKLLNKEITKGQLAWNITKNIGAVLLGEPIEENLQDIWQWGATGLVDKMQDGYGHFDNPAPTGRSMLETSIVTMAAGLLGGAGSIRTHRSQFIDEALDTALSKPKIVEDWLKGQEEVVALEVDPEKKQEAQDHINRLRSRWESLKTNVDAISGTKTVKGMSPEKRGQLIGLLADSNALEEEVAGITNPALKSLKQAELKDVNDQIKELVNPSPAIPAATTTTTAPATIDDEIDTADNANLAHDRGVGVNIEYFKHGQKVEYDNSTGTITDVHRNTDGTTHSVDITDDAGDKKTVVVSRKTPQETGIKILDGRLPMETGKPKTTVPGDRIVSAVITINGKEYEGKNHAEAILKAKADGQDISSVDRAGDGKFKLSDGTVITRAEAKKMFGQDRSELLIPQTTESSNADKEYEKITKKAPVKGRKQVEAHLSALKEAKTPEDKLNVINLFNRNVTLAPDAATDEEKQLIDNTKKELSDQGYETPELLGRKFDSGMRVEITNSIPDDTLADGEEVITKIIRPQINKDGKMVQAAQIEVTVGTQKGGLSAKEWVANKSKSSTPSIPASPELNPATNPALQAEIDKEHVKLIKERDSSLKDIDELKALDPEYDAEKAKQKIQDTYEAGVKKANVTARVNILKAQQNAELKKVKELGKKHDVTGMADRITKRYDDQILQINKEFAPEPVKEEPVAPKPAAKTKTKPKEEAVPPGEKLSKEDADLIKEMRRQDEFLFGKEEAKKMIPPKDAQRKIRDAKFDAELDSALDELRDVIKKKPLTSGGIDPEFIEKGAKVVTIYMKKGIYKFSDIIEDLYAKIGDEVKEMFSAIRQGYGAYYFDLATPEEADKMDPKAGKLSYDDIISKLPDNETEPEEEAVSEENLPDEDVIIATNETVLSEAELAATPKEIEQSLRDIERQIEETSSKIGKLVEMYDTEGIAHEYPNNIIGKQAAKDVRKHAKEIARLTGWTVDEVYPNIAPAGGDVVMRLGIPNTGLSMYVTLRYDPERAKNDPYNLREDTYNLNQIFYRVEDKSAKGQAQYVGPNRFNKGNFTAKELALTLFKEAKPYIADRLSTPVEIPTTITNAPAGPKVIINVVKSPNLAVKSEDNAEANTTRGSGESGERVDRPHQEFQQDILYGPETEGGTKSNGKGPGEDVLRNTGEGTEEELSPGGSRGSGEDVVIPGIVPVISTNPKDHLAIEPAANYHLPADYDGPNTFNPKQNFTNNLVALNLLHTLLSEERDATPEEQATLAKYVGFGGLRVITIGEDAVTAAERPLIPLVKELNEVVAKIEELGHKGVLNEIKSSTQNAHYTAIPIIRSIYSILYEMGFNGGRVLEPSAGIGNFFMAMPGLMAANSKLHAVEKDIVTGLILKKLMPKAKVDIKGYENVEYPANNFDLIISNVPFGSFGVHVKKDAPTLQKRSAKYIHNFFFAKGFDQLKEGGVMAFITSTGTMDNPQNKFLLDHINKNANFLGAIRLPSKTFKGNAGTEVTTDVIFIQKNTAGEKTNPAFTGTKPVNTQHKDNGNKVTINVNEYFVNNPDHVLGEILTGGLYSDKRLTVQADKNLNVSQAILDLIPKFPKNVLTTEGKDTHGPELVYDESNADFNADSLVENRYHIDKDGNALVNRKGELQSIPKTHKTKVVPYIALRNALQNQYELEMRSKSSKDIEANRVKLNDLYEAFVKKFGNLSSRGVKPFIIGDEYGDNVLGLENVDEETKAVTKATILSKRVMKPSTRAEKAESADDAIAISLNETGKLDLNRMAELLNISPEQFFSDNYGLFFKTHDGNIVPRSEYLSGNVKQKLYFAREEVKTDPVFNKNIEELEAVQPEEIPYVNIEVNIGARWLATGMYKEFIDELLDTKSSIVNYSAATDSFDVSGESVTASTSKYAVLNSNEKLVANGYQLIEAAMHGKAMTFTIKDPTDPEGKRRMTDIAATQSAEEKTAEIVAAFEAWIKADHDRGEKWGKAYNEIFNTTVKRSFDGMKMHIDGLYDVELMDHQLAAIAMIVLNNGGIVDHIVGAGKTFVMLGGAIKMKQMGIVNKPVIAALKSTIPEIKRTAKKHFPTARILAPRTVDFEKDNRRALLAKIRSNDWDVIIMSHEQFKFIPQDPEYVADTIREEIDLIRMELEQMIASGNARDTKQIRQGLETRIKNLENDLAKTLEKGGVDEGLPNFSEIGIDHIFVDESQQFKNLPYATKIEKVAGLGNPQGSARAFNLLIAIRTLQNLYGGDKGVTFLSGTPISNSLVEMYLLIKYMRPNKMKEIGYQTFDAWAKNAAKQSDELEFTVAGSIKKKTRFRKFINIPELALLYTEIADVRNEKNLHIERPEIRGGKADLVKIEQNDLQKKLTKRLIQFAKQKYGKRDGNLIGYGELSKNQQSAAMLMVTNLSTKMAIDMRLINPKLPFDPNGKLAKAADKIFEEYQNSTPTKGTQLVFSDVGTPKTGNFSEDLRSYLVDERGMIEDDADIIFGPEDKPTKRTKDQYKEKIADVMELTPEEVDDIIEASKRASTTSFNVYDEIKRLLIQKGMPPEEIAFIHSYKTDAAKGKLFDDVKFGKIRVLLGSTQKLGTGVNVQHKVVAMHHIDAPWRPSDMVQRNGRGIRRHNENKEVAIYHYGTEATLDAYKYQLIASKQAFIDQVKTGAVGQREYKEGDGEDLTAAEFVAALSGNPLIIDRAKLEAEIDKLARSKKNHTAEQFSIRSKLRTLKEQITTFTAAIKNREADLVTVKKNSTIVEDKDEDGTVTKKLEPSVEFNSMELYDLRSNKVKIEGVPKDSKQRNEWMTLIADRFKSPAHHKVGDSAVIGKVAGLDLVVKAGHKDLGGGVYGQAAYFFLNGEHQYSTSQTSFRPTINGLEGQLQRVTDELADKIDRQEKLTKLDGQTWPKEDDYEKALVEQKRINEELKIQEEEEAARDAIAEEAERLRKEDLADQGIYEAEPTDDIFFSMDDNLGLSLDLAPSVMPDVVNGFYSPLEKIITESKADKLPVKQWIEKFAKGEEAKWTGLTDWLGQQEGSVSKTDIQQYLKNNRIQIQEVVKGGDEAIEDPVLQDLRAKAARAGERLNAIDRELGGNVFLTGQPLSWYVATPKGKIPVPEKYHKEIDELRAIEQAPRDYEEQFIDIRGENIADTKYETYTLPGEKSNYKEVLVTLPTKEIDPEVAGKRHYENFIRKGGDRSWEDLSDKERANITVSVPGFGKKEDSKFQSGHWNEPNILVHLRMDTRTDADGNKVLFLEEVQSDWGQTGKKKGFSTGEKVGNFTEYINSLGLNWSANEIDLAFRLKNGPEYKEWDRIQNVQHKTPQAPFVTDTNAWTKLALKVALKEGVKQGVDKIAWANGLQQAERYDLSKQVDRIVVSKPNEWDQNRNYHKRVMIHFNTGSNVSIAIDENGKVLEGTSEMYGKQLEDVVGKDMAEKIMAVKKDNLKEFSGLDFKIGGEGMTGFYGNPEKGKIGILGNVAKSLFKQEVGITGIITGESKTEIVIDKLTDKYDVIVDGKTIGTNFDTINEAKAFAKKSPKQNSTQHSITITPELADQVRDQGQPLFSLAREAQAQDAKAAVDAGNPNPNGPIIIKLTEINPAPGTILLQVSDVWVDMIKEQYNNFYQRGLELIKGTPYAANTNPHDALAQAISDRAMKVPKDAKLLSWVKQFWKKVGAMMRLTIDPDKLQELTVDQYLDIAATQLRYGNDIYADLVADGAQVTDAAKPAGPNPEGGTKLAERTKALADDFEAQGEDYKTNKPAPNGATQKAADPEIPMDKHFEFETRDLSAKGQAFAGFDAATSDKLLRDYSGDKKKLIETVFLLHPTLKKAGITLTFHENPDSYYNAMVLHGGSEFQAIQSHGFYKSKQIHINLSKTNLKANTALHEAFHPIIREILVNDRNTFHSFMNDIISDPEMKKRYIDEFAPRYAYLKNADAINEEVLVEATADTVMNRILRDMKNMPESLFDRVIEYIKKALGDTYAQLAQFIDTKSSFTAFANSMADAISKGMAVPINADIKDSVRTIVNESVQASMLRGNIAPNGKQSNLTEAQYTQVRTPEFKAWFGDWENDPENSSKVLDENGEPLIVYRGDSSGRNTFDDGMVFFSENDYVAGSYSNPEANPEYKVFLNIRNPLDVRANNSKRIAGNDPETVRVFEEAIDELPNDYVAFKGAGEAGEITKAQIRDSVIREHNGQKYIDFNNQAAAWEAVTIYAKKRGYDGILTKDESVDKYIQFANSQIAFDPNQIKSATDNTGAFNPNNPDIRFSFDDQRKERIVSDLKHKILTNPDVNWEPIVGNLINKGVLSKHESDDILSAWRTASTLNLNPDKTIAMLLNMAGLQRLHKMDTYDNTKINQQAMQEFVDGYNSGEETFLERIPKYAIQEIVEDVTGSGDAHPAYVIEDFEEMNNRKSRSGQHDPVAAGPRKLVAASIAISEIRKEKRSLEKLYAETGDPAVNEQIHAIDIAASRLARAVYMNRSLSGASLGVGSHVLNLAGLTYESQMAHLEAINKAGKNIAIDPKDKETIKRLTDDINRLQDALDASIHGANPKKNKAASAEKEYNRKMNSSLESRPAITKAEALDLLRRRRATTAAPIGLSLSLDPESMSYEDIINELVKNIHLEIAEENRIINAENAKDPTGPQRPRIGGFKAVVSRIQAIDPKITEDDIYTAILSTTPRAKDNALSEYAKIQALTRKHVKDINNMEGMLVKTTGELLRKGVVPSESQMAEFGRLLKEIEKNIYKLEVKPELYTQWMNALDAIRQNYELAFLPPEVEANTDVLLGQIINAARLLKDAKFHAWLEAKNAKVQREVDLINSGRVSELLDQEDKSYRTFPTEMVQVEKDKDGNTVMEKIKVLDKDGNQIKDENGNPMTRMVPKTEIVPYNFGQVDRMIKDKQKEIDLAKNKYRKKSGWDKFLNGLLIAKATFGSSMAMADISVILNQGFKASLTGGLMEPGVYGKAVGKSLRAMRDEFRKNPGLANQFEKEIHDAKYYHFSQQAGLALTSIGQHLFINEMIGAEDAFDLALDETSKHKNVIAKTATVALNARKKVKDASNAQFATFLNVIAYNKFHNYMEKVLTTTGELPTPREREVLANQINAALGRTTRLPGAVKAMSYVLWAPRLYLSHIINVANIVGDPVAFAYHAAKGNGDLARIYGSRTINSMLFAASTTTLFMLTAALAKAICGDYGINMDPSKPSYLKIKCGELSLDPTSPVRQWVALGGRLLASWSGHPYTDFYGQPIKTKEQLINAFQYKTNPLISTSIEFADASDFLGRDRIPGDESWGKWKSRALVLADNLKPIAVGSNVDVVKAKGVDARAKPLLMAEALLGSNMNRIDAEKEEKRKEIEKGVKAKEKVATNSGNIDKLKQRLGNLEELRGQFAPDVVIPEAGAIDLTRKRVTYDGKSYRVFHRTDDPGNNGIDDDYYTIKVHVSGKSKGKKYLDRIDNLKKIH